MTIFVSIAAYRDPELVPTIADALRRARYPDDLRFGVCWQHGDDEAPPPELGAGRMRVVDVPWRQSRGACWARAQVMKLWDGEDFFLQLDSHHRFADGWDALLLEQAERTGAAKPVLSTYASAYDPNAAAPEPGAATRMLFDRFTPQGVALFQWGAMPDGHASSAPRRARFVSAHLLFSLGRFVEDVPYDPELYFIGEEITLAVRAFTHGYDLFHPGVHVAWHEYTRRGRVKHWDDHRAGQGVEAPWHERDAVSLEKAQRFLVSPEVSRFGCGDVRSFRDYETYAGLDFRRRFASRAAREGHEPAPPRIPKRGPHQTWIARIELERSALPAEALSDPLFWYVGFHDGAGGEIARDDAGRQELRRLLSGGDARIVIERRFTSADPPARWTVWPTDRRGRWLDRIDGPAEARCAA